MQREFPKAHAARVLFIKLKVRQNKAVCGSDEHFYMIRPHADPHMGMLNRLRMVARKGLATRGVLYS